MKTERIVRYYVAFDRHIAAPYLGRDDFQVWSLQELTGEQVDKAAGSDGAVVIATVDGAVSKDLRPLAEVRTSKDPMPPPPPPPRWKRSEGSGDGEAWLAEYAEAFQSKAVRSLKDFP
jgi:hypothetical protein